MVYMICVKSNGTAIPPKLFKFSTTNYMVAPSK